MHGSSSLHPDDPTFVDRAPPRVLVVDDDPAICRALVRLLGRWGYLVVTASTMDEALELLTAWRPRVMIVDRHLGDEDGLELLARTRALLAGAAPPVLICTGDALDVPSGAAGVVRKPFEIRELVQRVHDLTHRSVSQPGGASGEPASSR